MKNDYSIVERNRIVEENLNQIDKTIRRNYALMKAAHLDYDDVYQQLALRLIRCVENFDPDKGNLRTHIYCQLQYEMLNCKSPLILTGIKSAPADFRRSSILALDTICEADFAAAVA